VKVRLCISNQAYQGITSPLAEVQSIALRVSVCLSVRTPLCPLTYLAKHV